MKKPYLAKPYLNTPLQNLNQIPYQLIALNSKQRLTLLQKIENFEKIEELTIFEFEKGVKLDHLRIFAWVRMRSCGISAPIKEMKSRTAG